MIVRSCAPWLAFVVLPNVLCGQGLRGTIRDSTSGLAVPAAVISTVGLPDSLTRRVLSDATGIYRIQLPDGARRIRVVRIGFRPRTIDVPAASDQSVDIRLERLPTMLERVRVNDQPNCSRRSDRATALALWEQARAGLLATVVARDENQARLKRFNYYRIIGEERATILSQVVTTEEVRNGRPFGAARSASYFVSHGFRDDSGSYPTFYAPDADVLLDESFTKAYCFHVAEADERHPGAIGLGFEPAHSRAGRVDIAGTVWIDSTARSLSDIQFQYRGLPRDEQLLRLGGRVSFRVMPAGFTIIDRWSMQLPAHTAPPSRSP
ncbi:MAG TPA: carboxypeptidase-like regulatory domain-containing protein, partial [Gemmatimonadaceae bacterium]